MLALILDWEPLIDSSTSAGQGRDLDKAATDLVIIARILVPDGHGDIVADVLHVNGEGLVGPFWSLASSIVGGSLELLHPGLDLHIRVHLSEGLGITSQLCL